MTATQYECMSREELVEAFDLLCGNAPTGDPKIDELLREMCARLASIPKSNNDRTFKP